ncbi:protein-disulfide reductase DsbD family protein [Camelimonas fluminis]|uniref:Protein-disulfide reductase DsbD family protein n=1 Tax=Camelimonas fluminis TaxID=1576911 RepID=A0ABV7UGU0_9HYPH|nr:protein-disulfide reductase DsbD domain-containing protein [Camelimonas fluminis]
MAASPTGRALRATMLAFGLAILAVFALAAQSLTMGDAALANQRGNDLVKADLLIEPSAIQPGKPFTVALRLRTKEHWHTYWRNPGDSGLPTEIRWSLPPGFRAGPIQWPTPQRLPVGPLMNFGYEGETFLLTQITPPADLAPVGRVTLKADASWLVCEKECIPGGASLSASAPAAPDVASVAPDPASAQAFALARDQQPTPLSGATFDASGDAFTVTAPLPAGMTADEIRDAAFFPVDESLLENAAPQKRDIKDGKLTLTMQRSAPASAALSHLAGVISLTAASGATRGYEISIGDPPPAVASLPISQPAFAVPPRATAPTSTGADAASLTLWMALVLAFAGGMVLNLMPCVFPVLSIKVLSLAQGGGKTPRAMRLHGLSYGAGVLVSFVALAAMLIAARQAGASIGWGFQLQSPPVVALLAYVMFAMGLGLSGAVQLGASWSGLGDRLTRRASYGGSFFTGILAAVVASPCTGPFMGAAIGFSLTQSAGMAIAVFIALGAGLAFPFVLLTFLPALMKRMPRPGRWMEILKQALAFPLYATAAWLIWVLSQQVSPIGLSLALGGLVAVALAIWAAGLAAAAGRGGAIAARVVVALALVIAVACIWRVDETRHAPGAVAATGEGVEPFTQQRLNALLTERKPVLVNLTAAWCITCMVNERTTLDTASVRDAMQARGVAYLKGDWTNQNPEITALLARFGRGGVPLYLVYRGEGVEEAPVVLPQILTPATVIEALSALPARIALRKEGGDHTP